MDACKDTYKDFQKHYLTQVVGAGWNMGSQMSTDFNHNDNHDPSGREIESHVSRNSPHSNGDHWTISWPWTWKIILKTHRLVSTHVYCSATFLCSLEIEIYEDHLVATQACADFDQIVAGNLSMNITSGQSLPVCHRFCMTVLYLNPDDQHFLKLHLDGQHTVKLHPDQLGLQGDVFALPPSNAGNPMAGHNIVQL